MRIKTIFLIVITILLTVIIMQNNQDVKFTVLFSQFYISNLIIMALMAIAGFVIGFLIGRPRKVKFDNTHPSLDNPTGKKSDTLSDEDREYIN
ncbi:LapA family protein [Mucilaginibacter paludis]|uniref:Lipopolysaccharide assembly protein A domain-containing protein n=1 Tax=Mucilaginibacter paludis DSM 18603 TaxID=714943 RepID=H1YE00_9SPHI|nr:lipopolysaccharide assembly protein LapA domain-containing protein [Mucilaginibacter paludis]EHQ25178.1 hypothetical protein Mucpa_1004 [Mucilaginibacter paludis DSM 18603]